MEQDVERLYSTGLEGFAEDIFIFMVIMMEEKLLERRNVITHARGMMHQPMITGVV
jgi:hypothetical protein